MYLKPPRPHGLALSRRPRPSRLRLQQNPLTRDRIGQVTGLETEGARLAADAATGRRQANEGNANRALQADELNTNATFHHEKAADERAKAKPYPSQYRLDDEPAAKSRTSTAGTK